MIRKLIGVCMALAVVVAVAATAAWVYIDRQTDPMIAQSPAALTPAKAGLVLGTSRLYAGGRPNPYFDYRIATAASLYASGKVQYLIVSGAQAHGGRGAGGYDEPNDMRDALVAAGVPRARIYRDYAGYRTLDSVVRAQTIFGQNRVILVSQPFHLERALFLAKHHGLAFQGLAAQDVAGVYGLRIKLREAGARLKALFDVAVNRAPKRGGAPIRLGVDPPS
jgi:SanA protein